MWRQHNTRRSLLEIQILLWIFGQDRSTWCPLRVSPCLMSEERLPCAPLICRTNLRSHISHLVTEPSSGLVTPRHSGPLAWLPPGISSLQTVNILKIWWAGGQSAGSCRLQTIPKFPVPTVRACVGWSGRGVPVTRALGLGDTRHHWSGSDTQIGLKIMEFTQN